MNTPKQLRLFVYCRVTAFQGGGIEPVKVPFRLWDNAKDWQEQRNLVAQVAWEMLYHDDYRDPETGVQVRAGHIPMLRAAVKALGYRQAKERFTANIVYEELPAGTDQREHYSYVVGTSKI